MILWELIYIVCKDFHLQISKHIVLKVGTGDKIIKGKGGRKEKKKSGRIPHLHCFVHALILTAFSESPNFQALRMYYGPGL